MTQGEDTIMPCASCWPIALRRDVPFWVNYTRMIAIISNALLCVLGRGIRTSIGPEGCRFISGTTLALPCEFAHHHLFWGMYRLVVAVALAATVMRKVWWCAGTAKCSPSTTQ